MSPRCVYCGCTERQACAMPDGSACSWVKLDVTTGVGTCSSCALQGELHRLSAFSKIERVDVLRDLHGHWLHPAHPRVADDEFDIFDFAFAHGLELAFIAMAKDAPLSFERYLESESSDCGYWQPTPPGPEWFTLAIYHTDDGPVACFVRHPPALVEKPRLVLAS